ncbi:hypothetical protein [Arthrobacter sp. HS15c]|uniref:hypothetical protein n=1 Tax=Arthrobacter sp. HS15c TaxID=3230279 RepID=UPI003466ED3E
MRSPAASGAVFPTAIVLALLFTGCGPQAGPTTTSSPSPTVTSATGTPTAMPTATGAPSASAPASAAWTSYRTADGQVTFDHPAAWSVKDPAGELPEGGGAFAEVTNQAGRPLATLRTNMAVGSTCLDRYPYSVLESEELPLLAQGGAAPRFVYETRGNDAAPGPADTPAAAYGITSVPAPTGDSASCIFHFFNRPPTAAMFGAYYNPDNNVTPGAGSLTYLEQARKYADTDEYRDIRRMITSLRPAG